MRAERGRFSPVADKLFSGRGGGGLTRSGGRRARAEVTGRGRTRRRGMRCLGSWRRRRRSQRGRSDGPRDRPRPGRIGPPQPGTSCHVGTQERGDDRLGVATRDGVALRAPRGPRTQFRTERSRTCVSTRASAPRESPLTSGQRPSSRSSPSAAQSNIPLDILLVQYTAILPCGSPDYLRSLLVMRSYLCISIPPMFLFQKCFCIRLDQSSNEKSRLYTMK